MLDDEVVLNSDALLTFDPAISFRKRAQDFLASRNWSTSQVYYGDQPEPEMGEPPFWSFSFALGLDHLQKHKRACRADITALLKFLHKIAKETKREVTVQMSYRSKPWYSEHIAFVDEQPLDIIEMIERVSKVGRR